MKCHVTQQTKAVPYFLRDRCSACFALILALSLRPFDIVGVNYCFFGLHVLFLLHVRLVLLIFVPAAWGLLVRCCCSTPPAALSVSSKLGLCFNSCFTNGPFGWHIGTKQRQSRQRSGRSTSQPARTPPHVRNAHVQQNNLPNQAQLSMRKVLQALVSRGMGAAARALTAKSAYSILNAELHGKLTTVLQYVVRA